MSVPSPKRVLVTGGEGFVADHVASELRRAGHAVAVTVRPDRRLRAAAGAEVFELELPDRGRAREVLASFRPQAVVHLAARSHVAECEARPALAVRSNVEATHSLLEALDLVDSERACAVVLASSALVYRAPADGEPLTEDSPLGPRTVYGRTKLAAELAAECLAAPCRATDGGTGEVGARPLVIFRCFNHVGPGQDPRFVMSSLARQLARIELGLEEPVVDAGNLDVERDFTDVRDVARAYRLAVEGAAPPGTYNVASGVARSPRDILDRLRELCERDVDVRSRESLRRRSEARVVVGSAARLDSACGWRPEVPLERTIADVFRWWCEALAPEVRTR